MTARLCRTDAVREDQAREPYHVAYADAQVATFPTLLAAMETATTLVVAGRGLVRVTDTARGVTWVAGRLR